MLETEGAPRPRSQPGWRVIATKEFSDHITSIRFKILVALVALAGLGAVYAVAGRIREVADQATDAPALFLRLFTLTPEQVPLSYLQLVGLLVPLLGIAFGFDAVNGERSQGTLPRLVAQPIYRDDVINGKFVGGLSVIAILLAFLTIFVGTVGIIRLGVPPDFSDIARVVVYWILSVAYAGFWLALALLFSVVLRRAATSVLAAIATWLVLTIFAGLLIGFIGDVVKRVPQEPTFEESLANAKFKLNLARVSPTTLYQESSAVLLIPETRTLDILGVLLVQNEPAAVPNPLSLGQSLLVIWPQAVGLVAATALCFAGAYISFMRQEVRA